ncbi:hypothetical protein CDAR_592821 [Caerostris darwini]|uniref:Uncharacterized protein n=1 Tax=Caerostris darwini TaxID=1538125 RepID=A0AAV4QLI0_9ARAC|nr:hypothetical protein CDAR_592821 [Caerostris darwini]
MWPSQRDVKESSQPTSYRLSAGNFWEIEERIHDKRRKYLPECENWDEEHFLEAQWGKKFSFLKKFYKSFGPVFRTRREVLLDAFRHF